MRTKGEKASPKGRLPLRNYSQLPPKGSAPANPLIPTILSKGRFASAERPFCVSEAQEARFLKRMKGEKASPKGRLPLRNYSQLPPKGSAPANRLIPTILSKGRFASAERPFCVSEAQKARFLKQMKGEKAARKGGYLCEV
jgi:hypothetical protein